MPRIGWVAAGAGLAAWIGQSWADPGRVAFVGVAFVGLAVAVLLRRLKAHSGSGWARSASFAAFGAALVAVRIAAASSGAPPQVVLPDGSGPWQATVESVGSPRQGQQTAMIAVDVDAGTTTLRVAATLPRYPPVAPGDRVEVRGAVRAPRDDSYGARLRSQGIAGSLQSAVLRLLPQRAGLGVAVETIRRSAGDALARVLPEPQAGLAAGILIGLRDRVDRDLAASFTTAGVSHVVAISGWNIAIVGAVVAALLRTWPRRRRAVVTLLAVAAYTVLAGASASVVRAALMAAVVLLARESGREGRAAAALAWAALAMLVLDPAVVGDAGFSLSVAATAGLLSWGSGLTRWLTESSGGRMPGWIAESLGVSLAAQAWTLPIVLASFGRLALAAPLVNLAVVPLVAPAMAAGALALLGGYLAALGLGAVGTLLALPAWIVLGAMIRVVEAGAALPFASVWLEPPADTIAALVAAALLGLAFALRPCLARRVAARRRAKRRLADARTARDCPRSGRQALRRRRLGIAVLSIVAIAVPLIAAARPDGRVHVIVLDVGQGDAILVEGSRGGRLLVDGGPDPERLLRLLDSRYTPWDRRIDVVVLTHPHEDHVGGLPLLLERYRVGQLAEPGMPGTGPGYAAWAAWLRRTGRASERLSTGDRVRVDELSLRVLWPDPDRVPSTTSGDGTVVNGVSIVLLGEVGNERFLLTGDAEEGVDPFLLARGVPRVDLLKVAHHGSPTSTRQPLLDRLRPAVAIISVGAGNTYGHPGRSTLGRLAAIGARVLRTDQDGTVEATLDGQHLTVSSERQSPLAGDHASTERPVAVGVTRSDPPGGSGTADLLYHRADVRPRPRRSRRPAALPGTAGLASAPFAGGGRRRRLARGTGGGRRAPPRRGRCAPA